MKINSFKDFSKISVIVKLSRKKYNAILLEQDNKLLLNIDMNNDIDSWQNNKDFYKVITGNLIYENKEISFLDCQIYNELATRTGNSLEDISNLILVYRIDRVLFGKKINTSEINKIMKCEVCYKGMDCFTSSRPYKTNYTTMEYGENVSNYEINTKELKISINFGCSCAHKDDSLSIDRYTTVDFVFKSSKNIKKALDNIYRFRNFLILLLKRHVIVEKQYVYYDDKKFQLFDCYEEALNTNSPSLEEHLSHRCLKIENINNIGNMYEKYISNYNKLSPVIELYYNVTQFRVPNATRFINAVTMIENMSRNYDYNSALRLTIKNNPPNKKINDAEYKYMIYSLIKKVNDVYNLTDQDIDQISNNIKNARVYYIHYKKKNSVKKLSYEEQFEYSYFMQDIVLLNIYKLIKMDIKDSEYISFKDYYYEIKDLL